jgi:hypothetical protein
MTGMPADDPGGGRSRDALIAEVRRRASRRRLYRRGSVVVVATALAAAGVGVPLALAGGGGPSTIKVIAPPSTSPASIAPATTTVPPATTIMMPPASTTLQPHTAVETYNPWAGPGTLRQSFKLIGHLTGGSCPTSSIADPSNQDAWRCNTDQGPLYDPCFAPPGGTNVSELACAKYPYLNDQVQILSMSQPLPKSSSGFQPTGEWPLVLLLSNGAQCSVIQGTATYGGYNYGCSTGYATPPDTSVNPWTVKYIANGPRSSVTVTVRTAWM